ncbi:MAG: rRNA biogenesis protein rrp5 [Oscillospiraceae bacterium]|nr:rRNA biogenesis protein rrp5 [Parasporobacterium sp.]MBQ9685380.1 rRNA biogenesis protein rrp5 [Oscillospiraceae bacterium]
MKKKETQLLIEWYRKLSTEFAEMADALEGTPQKEKPPGDEKVEAPEEAPKQEEPATETAPEPEAEPAKTYTFEEVRGILAAKSRAGHREAVKALINKYGGQQLSDYKDSPSILAELVSDAEGI